MSSLGQLGQPKVSAVETFDWFDEKDITIGNVSDLVLIDFLDRARAIGEGDEIAGLTLLKEAFANIVAPQDYDRFWAASLANRQGTVDLMQLMMTLIEHLSAGRPIKRRSGSPAGRRNTATKSKAGSSSRAVMGRLERSGRADLALAVRDAAEARTG